MNVPMPVIRAAHFIDHRAYVADGYPRLALRCAAWQGAVLQLTILFALYRRGVLTLLGLVLLAAGTGAANLHGRLIGRS